jgi:probable F420-dependent oxidoreductase
MAIELGTVGAWLNPVHGDEARLKYAVEAEALGYGTVWLGLGVTPVPGLELVERVLDATETVTVATAIVNMWTNEAAEIARSYRRVAAKHPDRFLLGVGIGHPEAIKTYQRPVDKIVEYLDGLDEGGVPADRRVLAALGPKALALAAERCAGSHPYLTVPEHTRRARAALGPDRLLVPEQTVVVEAAPAAARAIARAFLRTPYLSLRNYVNNLLSLGFTEADVADGGSDRLVDALVPHGTPADVASSVLRHVEAGADHVGIQVLAAEGADPMPGLRALAEVLPG